MLEVVRRADALKTMIEERPAEYRALPAMVESVLACCSDLLDTGEADLALGLVDSATKRSDVLDPIVALRLQSIRLRGLNLKGAFSECVKLSDSILQATTADSNLAQTDECLRIEVLRASALYQLARVEEAFHILSSIRARLLRKPDAGLLALCNLQLAWTQLHRSSLKSARAYALEAVVSARRAESFYVEASAHSCISWIEKFSCHWQGAAEAAADSLSICELKGFRWLASFPLRDLGIIEWKRGRLEKATELIQPWLEASTGINQSYGRMLSTLILLHSGRHEESRAVLLSSRIDTPSDLSRPHLLSEEYLGDIELEQGHAAEALVHYDDVLPKALALVPKGDIVAELRRRRAECFFLLGRHDEAYQEAKLGLEHCRELGDRYEEAATYRPLALSAAALGNATEAKRWFEQGFAYYDDIETPYEWGKLWLAHGDWLSGPHAGEFADVNGALEAYVAARAHFERMGAQARLAEATERISSLANRSPGGHQFVAEATSPRRRPRHFSELARRSKWAYESFGIVTENVQLLHMLDDVAKLARSNAPVLVLGESGTGKELVAHGVHRLSQRAGSFLPINCSSLPREVIESELFGHAQGSFTGANKDKVGLLEVCDGGTVFLDELGEMPIELQSRLLRFLETGELRRVGATRNVRVDTRVVAATNRDRSALERGEGFRQDLYYRLAHAVIILPPLRRRVDDVELLAERFLEEACLEYGKQVRLGAEALAALRAHTWPGNVRELRTVIKRMVILAAHEHVVRASELGLSDAAAPATLLEELEVNERGRIEEALKQARGSRTEAARALGIPRTTLINKIRRYRLS